MKRNHYLHDTVYIILDNIKVQELSLLEFIPNADTAFHLIIFHAPGLKHCAEK